MAIHGDQQFWVTSLLAQRPAAIATTSGVFSSEELGDHKLTHELLWRL